ncbi:MAG: isochorismate synthase [Verrucomicrobia bacterium]|nr:isochorismate synthase [Verrucomicrobiota bacterium]MDA1088585.1 isochorismate synthase [Verrucomicrobiota bacterium]
MTTITETKTFSLTQVAAEMERRIRAALEMSRATAESPIARLVRIQIPVERVSAHDWLALQSSEVQLLWSGRDDDWCVAGVGALDTVTAEEGARPDEIFATLRERIGDDPNIRYYGGFGFGPHSTDDEGWREFGPSRFILPEFELVTNAEGCFFACNLRPSDSSMQDVIAHLQRLTFEGLHAIGELPGIDSRVDSPDRAGWCELVSTALGLIKEEVLEKLVLARRATFLFDAHIDAATVLARLRPLTSNCYHFLFQVRQGLAFMGTTPERLYRRVDQLIQSEVIAGTRPRSTDATADETLSRDLMSSEKDQREHDIVRKAIRQRLHLLCASLEVDETARLLKLERKQHLFSGVIGTLKPGVSDGEIMRSLHPTPAVGGYPSEVAVAEIERLEPFVRGWYAAPLGWVGATATEFAVAIRSGLVQGDSVSVYSGAGIVSGSVPDDEWLEIENKIVDFVKVTSANC